MGFDSTFKRMWEKGRKIDPLTHRALEAIVKQDSKAVRESARGAAKLFGGEGSWLGRRFNDLGDEADKNVNDPVRGIGRAAATTGLVYGGMAAAGAMSGGGAAAGSAAGPGMTASVTGPAGSGMVLGASGGGTGAGMSVPASASGTATGLSSTGLGGGGASINWARMGRGLNMAGNAMQQQEPPPPVRESDVQIEQPDLEAVYGVSSKGAKKSPDGGASQAIARGAAGADPLDTNGVQMAAIQALTRRTKALRDRINQLGQS